MMTNPSSKETIIEVKNITTTIEGSIIHKNLSLDVYKGEILAIVGGSGAGKTTLLRTLLMLQPIDAGKIFIAGQDVATADAEQRLALRQNMGVLFQHGALFSSLTVLENVAFPLKERTHLSPRSINEVAKLKIVMTGLEIEAINKYPSELSGGMKKRAALARAIALEPEFIFLDEPTSGLDPQGASSLDELILNLKTNLGLTIIIITHDVDTLWRIADRVAFLGDGRVLAEGKMEDLVESKNESVQQYFNDPRAKAARYIREEVSKG